MSGASSPTALEVWDTPPCTRRVRHEWTCAVEPAVATEARYVLNADWGIVLQLVISYANLARERFSSSSAGCRLLEPSSSLYQHILPTSPSEKGREKPRIVTLRNIVISARPPGCNSMTTRFVLGRSTIDLTDVPPEAKRWFSRHHCYLLWTVYPGTRSHPPEVSFVLVDDGSVNGTFLNGALLPKGGSSYVKHDDFIGVSMTVDGHIILGFRLKIPYTSVQTVGVRTALIPLTTLNLATDPKEPCRCLDCLLERRRQKCRGANNNTSPPESPVATWLSPFLRGGNGRPKSWRLLDALGGGRKQQSWSPQPPTALLKGLLFDDAADGRTTSKGGSNEFHANADKSAACIHGDGEALRAVSLA